METSSTQQQRDEDVVRRRYCKRSIQKMKLKKRDSGYRENDSSQKPESEEIPPVPQQLLNLIRMKAFREKLKTAPEMELHDPQHCRSCQVKQAELARDDFIRRKTTQLLSPLLEEKIQSHFLNRNSICLIGEVLRDLPRPSDDPGLVWKALKAREVELTQQTDSS
ncbi:hypothetical protein AALO_G00267730 [Alosa alosa]|uniref:Uncharacterized protein n=1 Tax=Alosa alosa TaxID=278164 RepID=A0AAV6FRG5_9TELE|nr:uncharacterized protein C8orf48 homolog [Alosa alosa]KAG5263707.1 hypothetical protein AALO_G00267730 [Alosa alosa]